MHNPKLRKYILLPLLVLLALLAVVVGESALRLFFINGSPLPPPKQKLITAVPFNLEQIAGISKYRSCQGHDYSGKAADGVIENNVSMKHYIVPRSELTDQLGVTEIRSPMDGKVVYSFYEGKGSQIFISPASDPDWAVVLIHVDMLPGVKVGSQVKAGQLLGHANTKGRHDFDLAVHHADSWVLAEDIARLLTGSPFVSLPKVGYTDSAFNHMTDEVLAEFKAAGFDPNNMAYTRDFRSQHPCNFDDFQANKDDWQYLPGQSPYGNNYQPAQQPFNQ